MSTPQQPPTPQQPGPFPPGDPRNTQSFPQPNFGPNPAWSREQQRAWQSAQREQAKAWERHQRESFRQQRRANKQQAKLAANAYRNQIRAQQRAMRRARGGQSLVGPLLLIAFAVAVLLVHRGSVSGPALVAWFSRWWPLLLIIAGLVRLVEWAVARSRNSSGDVPVRFSIGAGTVVLLFLLVVVGLGSQAAVRAADKGYTFSTPFFESENHNGWEHLFGSRHEEDAPAITHAIAADATLQVDTGHGDVTVTGTSTDNLVHLALHKEVYATSDQRAESLLADLNPQFNGTEQNLSVRIAGPDSSLATVTIQVPPSVHVVLNSNRGDVQVDNTHAPVTVTSNRGDVNVSDIAGDVTLHTNSRHGSILCRGVHGGLTLEGSGDDVNLSQVAGPVRVRGEFFGSGRLHAVAGKVDYDAGRIAFTAARIEGEASFDAKDEFSAHGITGPIVLRTRSRDITLARVSGDVHVSNSNGHVELVSVAPLGGVLIDNRDGDVSVTLPAKARFNVQAETNDGSVTSEYPGVSSNVAQSERGNLTASIGGGGPLVRITTTHGNINLGRNNEGALPAMPPMPAMPVMPPMPAMPANLSDAQAELRAAQKELEQAQREANRARTEADQERTRALADAARERAQGLAEADRQRQQADRERQRALAEADRARQHAEHERQEALAHAQKEIEAARREADRARQPQP